MLKYLNALWADTIINYRIFCIFIIFLMLSLAVLSIIKLPLKHDNSFEMFMLTDDPNIVKFENFRDLFGDAEYLSIGISARPTDQDLFVAETIKVIDEISSMLENHEFVRKEERNLLDKAICAFTSQKYTANFVFFLPQNMRIM